MKKLAVLFLLATLVLYPLGCDVETEPEPTMDVTLYFGDPQAMETGQQGEYGYVTPVSREIAETEAVLKATLEQLIKGPLPEDGDILAVMPDTVNILGITIEQGTATIDICDEIYGGDWAGGHQASELFMQAVTWTATQFEQVDDVIVLVEGNYWEDGHFIWDQPLAPLRLPEEIREWIDYSRGLLLAQAREYGEKVFLLVTYGERPTDGYSVEITDVVEQQDSVVVSVVFSAPGEDEEVVPTATYPYDIKQIEATELPVVFEASGDMFFLPQLYGLDWLPPIVAGSEDIRILSPEPGASVDREFTVQGIELVFEGAVSYRLLDSQGEELDSGIAVGGHGTEWGVFEISLTVPEEVPHGETITLTVYAQSPKDGSEESVVEMNFTVGE